MKLFIYIIIDYTDTLSNVMMDARKIIDIVKIASLKFYTMHKHSYMPIFKQRVIVTYQIIFIQYSCIWNEKH